MTGFPTDHPIPPKPSQWHFPALTELTDEDDLIAVGADLEPGTLLSAYGSGFFPMPVNRRQMGWFSPNRRGVLLPVDLKITRSLRRSMRRYRVTVNEAFDEVLAGCADPARPQGWIDHRIAKAYRQLHLMGWVHSIEVWDDEGLAGGLYGVGLAGLFAGESMFHRRVDASKVALVHLVQLVGTDPGVLIDVQWLTPHLASLGATECSRATYAQHLAAALDRTEPFSLPPHVAIEG